MPPFLQRSIVASGETGVKHKTAKNPPARSRIPGTKVAPFDDAQDGSDWLRFCAARRRQSSISLVTKNIYSHSALPQIGFVLRKRGMFQISGVALLSFQPEPGDWVCSFAPESGASSHIPCYTRHLRPSGTGQIGFVFSIPVSRQVVPLRYSTFLVRHSIFKSFLPPTILNSKFTTPISLVRYYTILAIKCQVKHQRGANLTADFMVLYSPRRHEKARSFVGVRIDYPFLRGPSCLRGRRTGVHWC